MKRLLVGSANFIGICFVLAGLFVYVWATDGFKVACQDMVDYFKYRAEYDESGLDYDYDIDYSGHDHFH